MIYHESQSVRAGILVLLLIALFVGTRFIHLSADPPNDISLDSCSEYGDPGNYAFNARSKVILGRWNIEELGAAPFSPIPHAVTYLSFLTFGTGIWQMNLVPLLFSALLLIGLYFLGSKFFPDARLLFFVLLVLNYPFGIFSRINDQVMPMTFFAIVAVYFFLKAWDRPVYFFLTAVCLGLSLASKIKMVYFPFGVIPLAYLLIAIQRGEGTHVRRHLVRAGYFLAGLLLVAIPWYVFGFARYPVVFQNIFTLNSAVANPGGIPGALSNWVRKPPFSFYPTNRLLTLVLFFFFLTLLIGSFNKKKKWTMSPLEIICILWLVIGMGVNASIGYRPIRHYIEYTIPMLILVSLYLKRLAAGGRLAYSLKKRGLFLAGLFVLVWVGLSSYSRRFVSTDVWFYHTELVLLTLFLVSLGATALLYVFLDKVLPKWKIVFSPGVAKASLAVLVGLYAYQNLSEHVRWLNNPTFDMKTIGRDLGKAFPQGVFSGLLMPSLSLENRNVVHTFFPHYANDDPAFLKRAGVTHLLIASYNQEPEYYQDYFPDELRRSRLIVRYAMWRSWFLLYEIEKREPPPANPALHEAEVMERDAGIPLFDPEASGRFSVRVELKKPVTIGRDKFGFAGRAEFHGRLFIRADDATSENLSVRVGLSHNGAMHFEKKFGIDPASARNGYLVFPFQGYLEEAGEYDLEVRASGRGAIRFDKVEIGP
jgi:4-amino-4-deoxy-L-arabinose transferase-like glycosyltransferase